MENNNDKEARDQRLVDLATDTLNVLKEVNMDRKWKEMERRVDAARRQYWWRQAQRVAAMLTIPLLLAVVAQYYIYNNKVEPTRWLEASTNPGMTTTVTLPDGTRVHLNSESSLSYPTHFADKQRMVSLSGEGYFEVSKNADQPFIVSTPRQLRVEVTGTHFNVEAYPEDEKVITTLIEGGVSVYCPDYNPNKKIKLSPRQKLVYAETDKSMKLFTTTGEAETAWKDGKIIFRNTPLNEALRMLEKRFNVEFIVKNPRLLTNDGFTGTFTHQRLERILEYFKISSRIKWRYVESPDIKDERSKIEIY
ncbi:MAG: FecR domain-containing protein [Mediterranea sp.]|jgi:ferric-dicitrate binding protein FerR (iron transport regulator)|nr:FecR domain-containing protein [Mediterranea sp.]